MPPPNMRPNRRVAGRGLDRSQPLVRDILLKTVVTHTVTYVVVGVLAFRAFDYPRLWAQTALSSFMRPMTDPLVLAGPLLQPARGLLFGIVFCLLREPFLNRDRGWVVTWVVLVVVGILGTFGAAPGSVEGMIYTIVPLELQFTLLPEVILQSFLLASVLFHWVRHPEQTWLTWTMWSAFVVAMMLPILALGARN